MKREYIIGTKPVPAWCRDWLMPYLKTDGTTGWEFYGKYKTYELQAGDVLTLTEQGISVYIQKRA